VLAPRSGNSFFNGANDQTDLYFVNQTASSISYSCTWTNVSPSGTFPGNFLDPSLPGYDYDSFGARHVVDHQSGLHVGVDKTPGSGSSSSARGRLAVRRGLPARLAQPVPFADRCTFSSSQRRHAARRGEPTP